MRAQATYGGPHVNITPKGIKWIGSRSLIKQLTKYGSFGNEYEWKWIAALLETTIKLFDINDKMKRKYETSIFHVYYKYVQRIVVVNGGSLNVYNESECLATF